MAGDCVVTAAGVCQVDLSSGKQKGNLQFYPTRFGRADGNCFLNIHDLNQYREMFLRSTWFVDSVFAQQDTRAKAMAEIFQPDGGVTFPPLSPQATPEQLEPMLKRIL